MNFRNEAIRTIQELAKQHMDYTLGDILFACFQKTAVKNGQTLNFLRSISDEDLYTEVEKTLKREENE